MGLYQKKGFKRLALLILIILAFPIAYFSYAYVGDGLGITSSEMHILLSLPLFTTLMAIAYTAIRFIYWVIDELLEQEM
jgi:hypothetical protein